MHLRYSFDPHSIGGGPARVHKQTSDVGRALATPGQRQFRACRSEQATRRRELRHPARTEIEQTARCEHAVNNELHPSVVEPLNSVSTYMLLWNPDRYAWPDADRLDILLGVLDGEPAMERWSIHANHTKVAVGDRVFLRKSGTPPRGIIASGTVAGPPVPDAHWGDAGSSSARYIDIMWDAMVEPEDVMDLAELSEQFPSAAWAAPGGGARIPSEAVGALEEAWATHTGQVLSGYKTNEGDGSSRAQEIRAKYGAVIVKIRRHQRAFRTLLLRELDHVCEFPGCVVTSVKVLEAAHIQPDSEGGEPTLENGLLLCRNHHRAMDSGLLRYGWDGEFEWADGVTSF